MKNTHSSNKSKADNDGDFERRSHDRQISILRLAKIESGNAEGWGLIRNVSSSGMMLDIHSSFQLADTINIVLTENHKLAGKVRWQRDSSVGIQFFDVVDVPDLLARALTHKNGQRARLPRIRIKHPVKMMIDSKPVSAEIQDISPAGLCIKSDIIFEIGKQLMLSIPQLGDVAAMVRWQSGTNIGLSFYQRVPIPELMAWLSTYHNSCVEAADIPSVKPVTKHPVYCVVGYDDLGKQVKIITVHSANDAMVHQKASSKYFFRVSVVDADGAEIFPGMLMQKSYQEQNSTIAEV